MVTVALFAGLGRAERGRIGKTVTVTIFQDGTKPPQNGCWQSGASAAIRPAKPPGATGGAFAYPASENGRRTLWLLLI
jgi:hypothetical protein